MAIVVIAFLLVFVAGLLWRQSVLRRSMVERLGSRSQEQIVEPTELPRATGGRPLIKAGKGLVAASFGGVLTFALCVGHLEISTVFAFSFATVGALVVWLLHQVAVTRRMSLLEEQLSDAIDLLISSLQSGASAEVALTRVVKESEQPIRGALGDVLGRLQFGDSAAEAFADLGKRVQLETYHLFSMAMAVHWGTGGTLVPLLASVAKTIRDRFEISRQARLQSTQSRLSALGILAASYLITLVIWLSNPEAFHGFVGTPVGTAVLAGAIISQGVGIVWISRMTEFRY